MTKFFVAALALLVIVPTALWGFPGAWALLAVVPAFIIAATIAHVRRPKTEPAATIRPGVLVLGSLFGLGTAALALMFMWAANAPSLIVIGSERVVDAPLARVWTEVSTWHRRTHWDNWVVDLEPMGDPDKLEVGSKYRSTLNLERHQPQAQQTVTELVPSQRIAWQIDPIGGAQLDHFVQTVSLEARGEQTLVRYQLSYQVDGVVARLAERIAMRGAAERMTVETLDKLNRVVTGAE